MLADGMREMGHDVEVYSPEAYFTKLPAPKKLKKWLGYIDQFIVFPYQVKKRIKIHQNTIYVFTDHALGMWVPIVKDLPHVIICHDFLAQRSALGEIPQNPVGKSGKIYQNLIKKGYRQGRNFISVSKKTQDDLHRFLEGVPIISEVILNGLNKKFEIIDRDAAQKTIGSIINPALSAGYIMHIGGNNWYKNRVGVVEIYNSWRANFKNELPLLLVGSQPNAELIAAVESSEYKNEIYIVVDLNDSFINIAFSGACLLLFPSLAEGFGWPIAEAMASGCPVITTNEAPMAEVGGESAIYLPVKPMDAELVNAWAKNAATVLDELVNLSPAKRKQVVESGKKNAERFNTQKALSAMEQVFVRVLNE